MTREPLAETPPIPLSIVTESALDEFQDRVDDSPCKSSVVEALILTEGGWGPGVFTVTVTLEDAVPDEPDAVMV